MTRAGRVQPTDRVSDVLARDALLVDVFARCSSAFERLRNPLTRRVMARLVTVEQAARMGGVTVDALLAELNRALGFDGGGEVVAVVPAPATVDESPSVLERVRAGAPVVELDVRDDLRSGREPFSRIMEAVASLPDDAVLRLRAPFEPVPLFSVMARRGFVHAARREEDGDWSVLFARGAARQPEDAAEPTTARADDATSDEHVLDVRGLEPPEPMVRTLAALEALAPGGTLVQINARVPQFLLPILVERGWAYDIDTTDPSAVRVRIHRAGDIAGAESRRTFPFDQESVAMAASTIVLDVRPIPGRDKHSTIFRTFDALKPGESMQLVNDHDPRPLRYQLTAERPGTFDWAYEEEGPEVWRVRIARTS